jgi:hypothetical protein
MLLDAAKDRRRLRKVERRVYLLLNNLHFTGAARVAAEGKCFF